MAFGSTAGLGGGFFGAPSLAKSAAPDWNANDGAYKDLYPEQKTLGPGEWGYKDPEEVAKLNKEWFAEHKQASREPQWGMFGSMGFGGKGGFGNQIGARNSPMSGFGAASELGF